MTPELWERLRDAIWDELEYQAENAGWYVDRSNGTIEGRFSVEVVAMELVERFGLVAEL